VNHVAVDEAQDASDVVIGMFLINSNPATVLFVMEHRILLYQPSMWQATIYLYLL
jgi:hypothetical protein